MADIEVHKIIIICDVCWGTKKTTQPQGEGGQIIEITCPQCSGRGYKFWGWVYEEKETIEDPECPMP